jgi:hypothetical protein
MVRRKCRFELDKVVSLAASFDHAKVASLIPISLLVSCPVTLFEGSDSGKTNWSSNSVFEASVDSPPCIQFDLAHPVQKLAQTAKRNQGIHQLRYDTIRIAKIEGQDVKDGHGAIHNSWCQHLLCGSGLEAI